MPTTDSQVLAVLVSDVHLSLRPPSARSAEPDWLEAQRRVLCQVRAIANEHNAPVVYAGDVFDKWNAPVELVNFAIDELPNGYAVPGQHDLPYHRYEDVQRTAYWTLVKAGVLIDLKPGEFDGGDLLELHGFPWGTSPPSKEPEWSDRIKIAVVHDYCWINGHSFPGVGQDKHAKTHAKQFKGFDVAHFGDNHKPFVWVPSGLHHKRKWPFVWNGGSLLRRHADEVKHTPRVGLLRASGEVESVPLDCSQDKFADVKKADVPTPEFAEFLDGLSALTSDPLDFRENVRRYLETNDVSDGVRELLLGAIE